MVSNEVSYARVFPLPFLSHLFLFLFLYHVLFLLLLESTLMYKDIANPNSEYTTLSPRIQANLLALEEQIKNTIDPTRSQKVRKKHTKRSAKSMVPVHNQENVQAQPKVCYSYLHHVFVYLFLIVLLLSYLSLLLFRSLLSRYCFLGNF